MRTQPIPIVGGSYADETRPWSQQDTVNYLPCLAEVAGTRSEAMLKTPPGLKPFVEIVDAPPVRATHNAEGRLMAVIGPMLYHINNAAVAVPVGALPGIGRVVIAHNQISQGNEILAVNGQAGYVWNTVTNTYGRITDPGYPGSATAVFIDGYLVQIEPRGRYAFNSDVASATQYNTLDRFTSEVSPDRLVAPAVFNNKLLLLSQTTSEWFENTGASQQPFRSTRITMDKGCAGPYALAHADNTVFFLGSDGMFYMVEGYRPVRISRRPLEQAIRGLNLSQAFAEVWEDSGFTVVYWTFPDGRTWGFNTADKEWHRRESYGLDRWRVNTMTRWNNTCIAGDFQKGRLWELDWDYILEGDQEFVSERTLAVIHDNQNLVLIPRVEVVMDTGQPETVPIPFPEQPQGPTLTGSAPDGSLGVAYPGFAYTATPGDAPIVRTVLVSGSVPTPLTTTDDGEIEPGTPNAIASYTGTWRTTDANGLWAEHTDTIAITAVSFAVEVTNAGIVRVSATGEDWSDTVDSGLGENVVLLAAAGGNVYAIGDGVGRVSTDAGVTWQDVDGLLGSQPPLAMAYTEVDDETVWVLGYASGVNFSRSTDGINFSTVTTTVNRTWGGLAGRNGTFVAPGTLGMAAVSVDLGQTFVDTYINPDGIGDMHQIIATQDGFVALMESTRFITSEFGTAGTWTSHAGPFVTYGALSMCEHGGRLVCVKGVDTEFSEDNCATWTSGGTLNGGLTEADRNLVHNGIRFLTGVGDGVDISDDGEEWTAATGVGAGSEFRVASLGNIS